MKKKPDQKTIVFLLWFLFFVFNSSLFAQKSWTEGSPELLNSVEINQRLDADLISNSSAAYAFNDIDLYEKAIETYNLHWDFQYDSFSQHDALIYDQFEFQDAIQYLDQEQIDSDVVIISESHVHPQHRVFTQQLLPILKKKGFTHLGLECLGNHPVDSTLFLMDSKLNERGYPLHTLASGRYARQAEMANLIREARALGFTIFSHERRVRGEERDLQQAKEVMRYRALHGNPKTVLHVGWYHAIESQTQKRKGPTFYLAGNLKHLFGIDPYTIYQDLLSEKKAVEESPFYKAKSTDKISVLVDAIGQVFDGNRDKHHIDLQIYHPATRYIHGRPHWLFQDEKTKPVDFERAFIKDASFPVIVGARRANENEQAAMADIIELQTERTEIVLALRQGEYMLQALDANGDLFLTTLSVD